MGQACTSPRAHAVDDGARSTAQSRSSDLLRPSSVIADVAKPEAAHCESASTSSPVDDARRADIEPASGPLRLLRIVTSRRLALSEVNDLAVRRCVPAMLSRAERAERFRSLAERGHSNPMEPCMDTR